MYGSSYYRVEPSGNYSSKGIREAILNPVSRDEIGIGISEPSRYTPGNVSMAFLSEVHFLGNSFVRQLQNSSSNTARSEVLDEMEVRDDEGMLVRHIKFYITPYNFENLVNKAGFEYVFLLQVQKIVCGHLTIMVPVNVPSIIQHQ